MFFVVYCCEIGSARYDMSVSELSFGLFCVSQNRKDRDRIPRKLSS